MDIIKMVINNYANNAMELVLLVTDLLFYYVLHAIMDGINLLIIIGA